MSEWKEYQMGEVCTELSDGLHKAPKFKIGGDYIFVNAKNIVDGFIVDNDPTKKTTHEEYLKYASPLNDTSILYSIDGTIGNVALYRGEKCILGKGACYMNPNPQILDRMFLYYELQSPRFKSYIYKMSTGSTIKHISLKTMRGYNFTFPSLETQRQISSILSSLDDKIAVNKKICENLEAQAQALFKHWFVDFAPFFAEQSGKAERKDGNFCANREQNETCFNSAEVQPKITGKACKFVESELGLIPEGWKVGILSDVLDLIKETTNQGERPELPYLPIDSIPMNSFLLNEVKDNSEAQSSLLLFKKDDILVGAMRVYFHRVVPAPFDGITRSTCFVLRPKCDEYFSFALCVANSNDAIRYAQKSSKGSTMPYAVWDGGLGSYCILIPPKTILKDFNILLKNDINLIQNMYFENNRLATLRDTLLPKLMSGQINLNEIEKSL